MTKAEYEQLILECNGKIFAAMCDGDYKKAAFYATEVGKLKAELAAL